MGHSAEKTSDFSLLTPNYLLHQAYQLTDTVHRSSAPAESDSPDIPCDADQDDDEEGGSNQALESNGGSHLGRNAEPDASQCSSGEDDGDGDGGGAGDASDRDGGDDDGDDYGNASDFLRSPLRHDTEPPSATESHPGSWSPYGLAAAYAAKMKWYLRRRGEPDTFRAANCMLKDAIRGPLLSPTSADDTCCSGSSYLLLLMRSPLAVHLIR